MGCPLFEDVNRGYFTRRCITRFEDVIQISNFDICVSDGYRDCPFYRIINKIEPICEFAEKCPMYFHIAESDFKELLTMTKEYCFSENYENCERYKLRKAGKDVPKELYPNGSIVELKT